MKHKPTDRWIYSSELDKVKVVGDGNALLIVLDDALEPNKDYPDVMYCRVKDLAFWRDFVAWRTKKLADGTMEKFGSKEAVEEYNSWMERRDAIAEEVGLHILPVAWNTKEVLSHHFDGLNDQKGIGWRFDER